MDYSQEWWTRLLFQPSSVGEILELVVSWHLELPQTDDGFEALQNIINRRIFPDQDSIDWVIRQFKFFYGDDLVSYERREPRFSSDYTLIFKVRVTQEGFDLWRQHNESQK